jgi:hypothetical protein
MSAEVTPPPTPLGPAQRDAAVEQLTRHFTAGRIDLEDFERRTELAVRAQSPAELDAALAGLEAPGRGGVPATPEEFRVDRPRRRPARFTLAALGGTDRRGQWAPARRHVAVAVMGGAQLDFRDAVLEPGVTDVHLFAWWGGLGVAVPPGLDVETTGAAILGGLERVSQQSGATDPRRPRLRLHCLAVMGAIEIRTLASGEPWKKQRGT